MPVLPAVDSTTSPPGLSSPRFSASRIIPLPARSFTDGPGFMNSALPRIVQPVASEARLSLMSGVLPIASTTSLLKIMEVPTSLGFWTTLKDPQPPHKRPRSTLLCEDNLPHVDVPRQESGLAI